MIQWQPDPDSPTADRAETFIATTTAAILAASAAASAGASIYGANKSAGAAKTGAQLQTDAANHAAELEAKSASDALDFAKTQEAARQKEFADVQARNYAIWQTREANLDPYRRMGIGSLGQLAQPIPGLPPQGSLGALVPRS